MHCPEKRNRNRMFHDVSMVYHPSSSAQLEESERETPINGCTCQVQPMFKRFEAHIDGPIAQRLKRFGPLEATSIFKRAIFYNVRVAAAGMPELSSGCFRILDESPPGFVMAFTESPGCCAAYFVCFPLSG